MAVALGVEIVEVEGAGDHPGLVDMDPVAIELVGEVKRRQQGVEGLGQGGPLKVDAHPPADPGVEDEGEGGIFCEEHEDVA